MINETMDTIYSYMNGECGAEKKFDFSTYRSVTIRVGEYEIVAHLDSWDGKIIEVEMDSELEMFEEEVGEFVEKVLMDNGI